jgi:hypothetical protein
MGHKRIIAYTCVVILISISIGAFGAIHFQKQLIRASAYAFWLKGAECFERKDYGYAIFYVTQAVTLKDNEPVFVSSLAEAFENKGDIAMSLDFYKMAFDMYKEKKDGGGMSRLMERKIQLLQSKKDEIGH